MGGLATDLNSNVDLSDLELPMISMNLVSGGETVSIVSDNLTVDLGFSNSSAIEECDAIAISPSMYGGAFADKLLEKGKLLSNVVTKHKDIFTIGITGTNGKTTSVHMLKSILENAGKKVLVGGNGGGGFSGYYEFIFRSSQMMIMIFTCWSLWYDTWFLQLLLWFWYGGPYQYWQWHMVFIRQ